MSPFGMRIHTAPAHPQPDYPFLLPPLLVIISPLLVDPQINFFFLLHNPYYGPLQNKTSSVECFNGVSSTHSESNRKLLNVSIAKNN